MLSLYVYSAFQRSLLPGLPVLTAVVCTCWPLPAVFHMLIFQILPWGFYCCTLFSCYNCLVTSYSLSPPLDSVPLPFLCGYRKTQPPLRVQVNFDISLLLLHAGNADVNPGLLVHNLRLGTVNAHDGLGPCPTWLHDFIWPQIHPDQFAYPSKFCVNIWYTCL